MSELPDSVNELLAAKIREELGRRRMSRQRLADEAKISISTLEKVLNGSRPFTTATVVRLEAALGIALRSVTPTGAASPTELGSYSHAAVDWLEGDYLTLRPSFEIERAIFAYRTQICWDEDMGCLIFREADRVDAPFSQEGVVSVPNKSGLVYLHTNEQGQMRLAILNRPQITGEMYGLLTTLASGAGNHLTPVSTPLALVPWRSPSMPVLGRIRDTDDAYQTYEAHLRAILSKGYARIIA